MLRKACLCLALVFVSCKPQTFLELNGYILGGQNDISPLQKSNSASIPQKVIDSSVLIATQVTKGQMKFCSGTLVAPEDGSDLMRVLTNHHCFANVDQKGKIDANWIPVACLETSVYFGFNIDSADEDLTIIPCKENSLRSDVDGDVAVFTLKENPPEKYEAMTIRDKPETGEVDAVILHYPDIAANYKKVEGSNVQLPAASITQTDCGTKGPFPKSEWKLDRSLPFSIRHTCDLVQGSSGSALLDAKSFEILGVNWGGIKINYTKGSSLFNVATSSEFVLAFLANDVDEIKKGAREYQRSADAEAADGEVQRYKDEKKGSLAGKMKEAACGQIGLNSPVGNTWSILVFLLLLIPALFAKMSVNTLFRD